jgi:hypothetical protein
MNRTFPRTVFLTLGVWLIAINNASADQPITPAEQLTALVKECQARTPGFREAVTDVERNEAIYRGDRFALRFLELAEQNPKDPTAIDALVECIRSLNAVDSLTQVAWEINKSAFPVHAKSNVAERAAAILLREYVASARISPVCLRISYSLRKEFQPFLRNVLEKNPHKDVRALACLALAESLNSRLQKLDLVKERPELAKRFEELFGKEDFDQLRQDWNATGTKEVESLLEVAAQEYGNDKHPYGGTIGQKAGSELFEIRNLTIGKVSPDIEGVDQDGKRFKLSDYRGKVVLLDFWSYV